MSSTFTFDQKKLEAVIHSLCQLLEEQGLIPRGQAKEVANSFLKDLHELGIQPQEVLRHDAALRPVLDSLLSLKAKGLNISSLLGLIKEGPDADLEKMKIELNQIFKDLIKLEKNPQKKLLLTGMQHTFNRMFDHQLRYNPRDLPRLMLTLMMNLQKVAEKMDNSMIESLEARQLRESIQAMNLGADTRSVSAGAHLESEVGNAMGIAAGAILGLLVSSKNNACQVNLADGNLTAAESQIIERDLATDPIITPLLAAVEASISSAHEDADKIVASASSPRPHHP